MWPCAPPQKEVEVVAAAAAEEEEEGLVKAKAVNEMDTERDRATPAWEARSADAGRQGVGAAVGGVAYRVQLFENTSLPWSCTALLTNY